MIYFSIDTETTGVDPEECQTLEIGVIMEDTENPLSFEESKKFRAILPHKYIQGSPFALNLNKDLIAVISEYLNIRDQFEQVDYASANDIIPIENVAANFSFWLERECNIKPGDNINVAGKNFAVFDDKFLNKIPHWRKNVRINRRTIDPAVLCVDWKIDKTLPNLALCLERVGIEKTVAHTSLEDAWDVIQILRKKGY